MTSGSSVYSEIQDKLREVESQSTKIGREIQQVQGVVRDLSQQQEDAYVQLALVYLPEMEANAVKKTIKEVRGEVQKIFDRKNARRAQLEELVEDASTQRTKIQTRLNKITTELDEATEQRLAVEAEVGKDLSQNPTYTGLVEKNKFTTERLKQDEIRSQTFAKEVKAKIGAYESDSLFMYLIERGYGTSKQKGNNLTRILDSVVAKVVNFEENKQNYLFLEAMPKKMQEEIEQERKQAEEIQGELKKVEMETATKYKLPPIQEECRVMIKTREDVMGAMSNIDGESEKYRREITQLDNTKGSYHAEAIKNLRSYLAGESLSALKERARQTPDKTDDGLVEKIEYTTQQMEAEKDRINELAKAQRAIQEKVEGIKKIERNFSSNDYESSRSTFGSGFDINTLLTGYLLGRYSVDHIDSEISSSQHFKPVETYHSSYSSHSDSGSSSSSSFGGGFSSGGGFGGGGSSTGGGF